MKQIDLTWYQRIALWSRVGVANAPTLKEAATLMRAYDKIRPTDEERQECQFTETPGGFSWKTFADRENFGTRIVDLEDEEATAMINCLEQPNMQVAIQVKDAKWMLELVEKLQGGQISKSEEPLSQMASSH